jgi:hypothetical protein
MLEGLWAFSLSVGKIDAKKTFIAAILTTVTLASVPAYALTVKDFEALPIPKKTAFIIAFIETMTRDIGRDNPQLARNIHDYFFRTPEGERFSEDMWNLEIELTALESVAKDGKVDLSKIQVEGIVVKVVKDKFPSPAQK